jgi:3-dehydroquinate dehydratase / shikimate dehydrogenase
VDAVRLGAEFVDVEWRAAARDRVLHARRDGDAPGHAASRTQFVLSHHDFQGVPADLADQVRAMRATGADIVKVAVAAESLGDCLTLKRGLGDDERRIGIAMGPAGQLTRLWPAWIGSCWTFGGTAAPGQIATADLVNQYRVRQTSIATAAYGVVGSPVGHSASPAMHNAAFVQLGLDAVYLPLETAGADDLFRLADELPLVGVSVTIPLKQSLLTSSVIVDDLARRIGALNTLKRTADGWEGRNFDVAGFLAPLDERTVRLNGRRAVVLGAGGAARAAVSGLSAHGAEVEISARRFDAARALAAEFHVGATAWPPATEWDLLVNTTPAGMWPDVDSAPVPLQQLRRLTGKLVYDLVYNPAETTLLRHARSEGAETIGGLEMLVSQACRQFEWWTGRQAPRAVMEEAAERFLG